MRAASKRKRNEADDDIPNYPDGAPGNDLEEFVSLLDQEAFETMSYARVDDLLVYALFASKRYPDGYRAFKPQRAFRISQFTPGIPTAPEPPLTLQNGLEICQIFNRHVNTDEPFEGRRVESAFNDIMGAVPHLFTGGDEKTLKHLLSRYALLYCQESPVRLEKVCFEKGVICAGLKACRDIAASMPLLATCGSMSSNVVADARNVISVVSAQRSQKGPKGPRLVLGPFRFVNHDCNPNCQIRPIKNTHACIIYSIADIEAGQSITVRYTEDRSYFVDGACQCSSCTGKSCAAPKREQNQPKKKTYRSGKKERGRREQRMHRMLSLAPKL